MNSILHSTAEYAIIYEFRGSSSEVERQLPKLNVAGSNPVSRSSLKISEAA